MTILVQRLARLRPHFGGAAFVVIVLLTTLTLAGVMAYAVSVEERSHHATAERVLQDYAGTVAWKITAEALARLRAGEPLPSEPRALAAALVAPPGGHEHLLPPALTRGAPRDSLLSLWVTDSVGRELYRSGATGPDVVKASAAIEGGPLPAGLRVHVALQRDDATELLLGGPPACRIPVFLGLLTLSGGLVTLALRALRREGELARLRTDFVSGVSHELRTPLTQIRMFAETLRLGWARTEADRQRSIQVIEQEALRLTHLVENVLHFARAERHVHRLVLQREALAPLIRDVVASFAPLARSRGCELRTVLDEDIEADVDRGALRQILLNLLDNAVKYGTAGQVVSVSLTRAGARARICVDDQGAGIAPEDMPRIWNAFTRLERDVDAAVAGSGIGLAVVRQLVVLHGGAVAVDVSPEGGARFVVELPVTNGRADGRTGRRAVGATLRRPAGGWPEEQTGGDAEELTVARSASGRANGSAAAGLTDEREVAAIHGE